MDKCVIPHPNGENPVPKSLALGKGARKNLLSFVPFNPLRSLVSHERIQGNPRKSNPNNHGFSQPTATVQGNPNQVIPPPALPAQESVTRPTQRQSASYGFKRWNVSSPCIEKVTMSFASRFIFMRSTIRIRLSS